MRRYLPLLLLFGLSCSFFIPEPTPTSAPTQTPAPPTETSTPAPTSTHTPTPTEPVTTLPDPSTVRWTQVVGGLNSPVAMAHAGDGRLFIVEQPGVIRIFEGGGLLADPFLDIRDRVVDSGNEQGLLGLAFHPDHAANGWFYVNYTGAGGATFISRFSLAGDPNRADPGSEKVILNFSQPFANHNGGDLAFGPDGTLYIATGDGGSAGDPQGNAQNLNTLLGKVLRIDVDGGDPYAIPADNPFAGSGRPEIWDYGLRNPWRIAFDSLTGDLYIADVGQGAWEEVNFEPAGSGGGFNYGWDFREGAHPFEGVAPGGLTDPVAEYSHNFGCSVSGGVVVRSPTLQAWDGVYLYGDFCSGLVLGMARDASAAWQTAVLFDTGLRITSFGADAAGEVYLLDRGGAVFRLEPAP